MKHFLQAFGYVLAATLLGLASAPVSAPAQQAPAHTATTGPGNAENGRKAFMAHSCYSCHGYSAEGGVGKRLVGYGDTLQAFAAYVRKPTGSMPPAGATITAAQLTDIYTWVRSLPPSPDPKSIDLLKP